MNVQVGFTSLQLKLLYFKHETCWLLKLSDNNFKRSENIDQLVFGKSGVIQTNFHACMTVLTALSIWDSSQNILLKKCEPMHEFTKVYTQHSRGFLSLQLEISLKMYWLFDLQMFASKQVLKSSRTGVICETCVQNIFSTNLCTWKLSPERCTKLLFLKFVGPQFNWDQRSTGTLMYVTSHRNILDFSDK